MEIMNNTITEDYVSFEVAKLLKEKGFSAYCTSLYTKEGKQNDVGNYNGVDDDNYISYSRPTHALAIKWIRENFGIRIIIDNTGLGCFWTTDNAWEVKGIPHKDMRSRQGTRDMTENANWPEPWYKTSEEATEAALLYTLQNLIP